jgi:PAS domain S-box-containing protein
MMGKNGFWIDSIGAPVMILNDQGIIQEANHPVLLLLGREKISGQDIRELVEPSEAAVIDQVFETLSNGIQKHVFEVHLRHQSGEGIKTRVRAAPIWNESGVISEVVFTLNTYGMGGVYDPNNDPLQNFEELRWLSDQGRELLSIENWSDLLDHAGEAYLEICKPAIVLTLSRVDEDKLKLIGVHGLGRRSINRVVRLANRFLSVDRTFVIEDRFKEIYNKRRLTRHPAGLIDFLANLVPEKISQKIIELINIHNVYTIGLQGNHSVMGCVYIFTQMPSQELPVDLVESFTFQVALALEKNQYARDLKESEQRFQTIFEYAPDGYYINDQNGVFVAANRAAEDIIGQPRDDLIGKSLFEMGLLPREHLAKAGAMLAKNVLGNSTGPDWFPLLRPDGSSVDVEISTHPVTIDDQHLVLGIARDITKRKEQEKILGAAHDNLKTVLESIDAHVYVADMETYEILYMNQRMIKDFGGDKTGQTCFEVFCTNGNKCAHCTNDQLLDPSGGPGESVIWEGMNQVTGRWYRIYDRAIYWQDQQIARLQIAVDITDYINASRELEESELRFRSLFESSRYALMTLAPPGWLFTSGNSALVELFGFENEEEFLSYRPWEISPKFQPDGSSSKDKALEMIQKCINQGSNSFNWIHKKKNGQDFPAIVQLTRVDLDEDHFIQATVIDITDRVNSERILQQQMNNLEIINDLNIAANQGLDLHDIFRNFSEQLKEIIQVIHTHIYLYDAESQSLSARSFTPDNGLRNIIEGYLEDQIPSLITIPIDKSPFYEELVVSASARIITDSEVIKGLMVEILLAAFEPRADRKKVSNIVSSIHEQSHVQSVAVVPIMSGNELFGFMDIVSDESIQESSLEWLKTVAEQLSVIIQRIKAEADKAAGIQELEMINRAIIAGSRLDDPDEICKHLADIAHQTNPDCYVMVSLLDPEQQAIRIRAIRGLGRLSGQITKLLGRNPQDVQVNVNEAGLSEDLKKRFTSGRLEQIPGGFFDLTRGSIPEKLCELIEKTLGVKNMYIIGFGLRGESTGGLTFMVKEGGQVQNSSALETITNHFSESIESRFAQKEIVARTRHLEALRSVELEITSTLELEDLLQSIAEKAAEIVNAKSSGFCVYDPEKNHLDYLAYTGFERLPENRIIQVGEGLSGKVWEQQSTIIVDNYSEWPDRLANWEAIGNYFLAGIPVCFGQEALGVLEIAMPVGESISPAGISLLETFAVQAAIAIKNARLYNSERIKRQEAETLQEVGLMVSSHLERSELLDSILIALQKVVPYHSASIQLVHGEYVVIEAFQGEGDVERVVGKNFPIAQNALAFPVLREGKNVILDDVSDNPDWIAGDETKGIHSWIAVPLQLKGEPIGLLTLDHRNKAQYQEKDAVLALNFATQAAIALENSRLFEEAKNRLFKIESLRQIDLAISGSVDLEISMNVLIRQLISSLDVDAATVLVYHDKLKVLKYLAGHGFVTDSLQFTNLRIGQGLAGKVAQQREMIFIGDLNAEQTSLQESPHLANEKFVSYVAYPLITKGEIVGVLEVFQRSPLEPDSEWFNFLEALAGQAAIAIDRLNLFVDLEQSNLDLLKAYEATIEGWSKALEMHDRESEGHNKELVELTLRLAMRMGVRGEELLNIRRGALLHDIGKMAIPDQILLKPDKLTEEEWSIMKMHPSFAAEMLSPIDYLKSAMDIPFYHHERWDGRGYTQGLKGKEIPLSARIFAVVDVWDALQSDRSYRPAWTRAEALRYIKENSGSHFDPGVVSEFLQMIKADQDK